MALPPEAAWFLAGLGVALLAAIAYRYRRVEWIFLVTNGGILVASVSRGKAPAMDTDLLTGMLTALMDFTKESFSDDRPRELDYLSLGDRRVELVQGKSAWLAAVYAGRTRGALERKMKSLLAYIEARYPQVAGDVIDTADLGELPFLLQRFLDRAWWPVSPVPHGPGARGVRTGP